jgi:hypothetical protein
MECTPGDYLVTAHYHQAAFNQLLHKWKVKDLLKEYWEGLSGQRSEMTFLTPTINFWYSLYSTAAT